MYPLNLKFIVVRYTYTLTYIHMYTQFFSFPSVFPCLTFYFRISVIYNRFIDLNQGSHVRLHQEASLSRDPLKFNGMFTFQTIPKTQIPLHYSMPNDSISWYRDSVSLLNNGIHCWLPNLTLGSWNWVHYLDTVHFKILVCHHLTRHRIFYQRLIFKKTNSLTKWNCKCIVVSIG